MKKLYTERKLEGIESDSIFRKTLEKLYNKEWIVYCKPPFKGPEHVIEYLGRYTHKVAISNQRICRIADGKITFKWRDYKDGERNKQMTVDVFEFIRRFLLHILPQGFMKIRHYGILSNRNRDHHVACCKAILGLPVPAKEKETKKETWSEFLFRLTGVDPTLCSVCGKGHMITKQTLQPHGHAPPQLRITS